MQTMNSNSWCVASQTERNGEAETLQYEIITTIIWHERFNWKWKLNSIQLCWNWLDIAGKIGLLIEWIFAMDITCECNVYSRIKRLLLLLTASCIHAFGNISYLCHSNNRFPPVTRSHEGFGSSGTKWKNHWLDIYIYTVYVKRALTCLLWKLLIVWLDPSNGRSFTKYIYETYILLGDTGYSIRNFI